MEIPQILKKKIIRGFGPRGQQWLDELPGIVEKCIAKWDLTQCRESEVMSYNYVCFADSPDFGQVALKVGIPHFDLETEMTAIQLYAGKNICKCHALDKELSAMLLERIRPGYDLTRIADSQERVKIAADLIAHLPLPLARDNNLPLWSELARKTFGRLRAGGMCGERMLRLTEKAEELILELENSGRPRVLLHGDLNHWNILNAGDGQWKAIDPKGQAGVACMEAGRFMLNELEIAAPENPAQLMDNMTAVMSEKLGELRWELALTAFLDKALSTSWKFEEHQVRDLSADVAECQFLYNYYCKARACAV